MAAAEDSPGNRRRFQRRSMSSRSRSSSSGDGRRESAKSNNEVDTLYSPSSRRELRSARARQQQRRATADDLQIPSENGDNKNPPKRSLSADYQFALDETSGGQEDVTLGVKKNAGGGVKLELRVTSKDDSSKALKKTASKRTLDTLIQSNHPPRRRHNRRRQRLTARGTNNRWELRKSLSYGQMQDLTRTLSKTDLMELKESLHGVQEQRKLEPKQLAEKLADMFEAALQNDDAEKQPQGSLIHQLRKLIMALTVKDMGAVVQHLDQCQTNEEPLQWEFIRSILDPEKTVGWDNEVLTKEASQGSGLGRKSEDGGDVEERTWMYEEESQERSLNSDESSYLGTDEGQGFGGGYDPHDDDTEMTGYSLDAYTENCNSSITIEDWSDCDLEESFALSSAHGKVFVEMADSFESSAYEVVEESFVMSEESILMEESVAMEESVYMEESVAFDESQYMEESVASSLFMEESVHVDKPVLLHQAEEDSESEEEDLFVDLRLPIATPATVAHKKLGTEDIAAESDEAASLADESSSSWNSGEAMDGEKNDETSEEEADEASKETTEQVEQELQQSPYSMLAGQERSLASLEPKLDRGNIMPNESIASMEQKPKRGWRSGEATDGEKNDETSEEKADEASKETTEQVEQELQQSPYSMLVGQERSSASLEPKLDRGNIMPNESIASMEQKRKHGRARILSEESAKDEHAPVLLRKAEDDDESEVVGLFVDLPPPVAPQAKMQQKRVDVEAENNDAGVSDEPTGKMTNEENSETVEQKLQQSPESGDVGMLVGLVEWTSDSLEPPLKLEKEKITPNASIAWKEQAPELEKRKISPDGSAKDDEKSKVSKWDGKTAERRRNLFRQLSRVESYRDHKPQKVSALIAIFESGGKTNDLIKLGQAKHIT